jgi:hypothetical protein
LRFILRAHHLQTQAHRRRIQEASATYATLDSLAATAGLPDRAIDALYEAWLGYRLTRPWYIKRAGVEARTAGRDLAALTAAGFLNATGSTKARTYEAGPRLNTLRSEVLASKHPLVEPYPVGSFDGGA